MWSCFAVGLQMCPGVTHSPLSNSLSLSLSLSLSPSLSASRSSPSPSANTVYAMKGGITNGIVSVDLTKSPPSVVEDKVGWVQSGGGIGMSTDGTTLYVPTLPQTPSPPCSLDTRYPCLHIAHSL
eukprot:TRINITY_DN1736_c0_g1_i4.p2 TRINITY_DN1736_c0_g1~~TRINITY_DN1736_c0_g1_i4.p2  ORF type:complete len:125 (+),score=22.30 TRINITY_DN1736_c0_g1_i4:497-871(+)